MLVVLKMIKFTSTNSTLIIINPSVQIKSILVVKSDLNFEGFSLLFSDEMAECHKSEVTLHDIDATAVELLVEFAYTSEIKITEDNVQV